MTSRYATRFTALSELIRQGFNEELRSGAGLPGQDDEPVLAGRPVRELVNMVHNRRAPLPLQDEVLAATIRCYRRSPSAGWAAVLLEMLSPMLVAAGSRFAFLPDGVTEEDVHHQLMVEALHVARFAALPKRGDHVQLWAQRRVLTRVARWLTAAVRSQGESLERVVEEGRAYRDDDQLFLVELSAGELPEGDVGLLYCSRVLGMTVRELAIEMGVSVEAVRTRRRRALRRLRRLSRAESGPTSDHLRIAA